MRHTIERTGIHEIEVHESIPVIVKDRHSRAVGLDDVCDPRITELVYEIDARLAGDILEEIAFSRGNGWRQREFAMTIRGLGNGRGILRLGWAGPATRETDGTEHEEDVTAESEQQAVIMNCHKTSNLTKPSATTDAGGLWT
jgi:hypothetical protein